MSNFVAFERVVFGNFGGIFMDTNFDKKIFIENFKHSCIWYSTYWCDCCLGSLSFEYLEHASSPSSRIFYLYNFRNRFI